MRPTRIMIAFFHMHKFYTALPCLPEKFETGYTEMQAMAVSNGLEFTIL